MRLGEQEIRLDESFTGDPHPLLRRLRVEHPVRRAVTARGVPVWLVTRYADARALLADSRLSKDHRIAGDLFTKYVTATGGTAGSFTQALAAHMLNSDPPDHTRLRRLVNKAFTARTVARLRPRIEEITGELLDAMAGRDTVDLLASFAFPLPITVICELLGVPGDRHDDFQQWSNVLVSSATADPVEWASLAMSEYLAGLVAAKRAEPTEDLLSDLVHASDEGDRLSPTELVSMAFLLLVAGHETTVNLIGNAVLALLRHPEQLAALRADPGLMPNAVEEFLRYESPVNIATLRFTTEPVPVGEVTIPPGEFVMISLLSANRDTTRFPGPDRLDVTRQPGGHLAFGHGIHYCVGAPLARLEAEIALTRLLARFPDLALAAEPETLRWRDSTLVRGLATLPVRPGEAAASRGAAP
ncbi:Cytochrome P450 [Amycolatopsis arida]|uniref:Cytochrome P450 n=1 Tax=Amycolatopsis arida TaxID=587909 RepID=A0A1I5XX50_9PSEU|nr:cytochrome P450 [Amycolatopsis arida]TDX97214.1 cytochrome P450 [Amycolatopsis arida]SFQ36486.1 Cytochrome P450 [Amycolatopsis arida]